MKHASQITVLLLAIAGLIALGPAARALAQVGAPQYVESLEGYQQRIEGLIHERLSALLPRGNFVARASVKGSKVRVPRAAVAGAALDLPGFRPAAGEAVPGEERFRVEQVLVRIVLNEQVPEADLQYIRTIVPILADFQPERGDRLDLRVVSPATALKEAEETALGLTERPFGLSWMEWLVVGVFALMGAIAIVVLLRVIFRPRAEPTPVAVAPPSAAPAHDDAGSMDEERRRMEAERQLNEVRHAVVKHLFARPELGGELIANWQSSPGKLNALIHGLGAAVARQAIMPHLGREAYQDLEETVRQERPPDTTRLLGALQEAKLFLLGQEITNPELIRPTPFRFLDALTWGQVAHLIKDEPVNVKAIVLSGLKPEDTARIMETLPKEMQLEIAVTIGRLQDMPLEMAQSVATDLAEKARHVPDARLVEVEGPQALVDMMGRTSSDTSHYLLEALKSKDAKLSEEVEKRFFMFDAIPLVPDEVMPQAVRTLPSNTVIIAMQGAHPDIQRKVIMAFPEQTRTGLVTALRAARADPEAVETARRQMVANFQALGRQGRIDLKQISDAWQAQAKAS